MKTNKTRAKKVLVALFAMLMPLLASAYDFKVDVFFYNITSSTDLTVEVTYKGDSYNSYSNEYKGIVNIPSTVIYDGTEYYVKSIGDYAFRDCYSLTAITIPEGVTSIGKWTFAGCYSLTAITIPESVMSIGDYAFEWCSSLTAVHISDIAAWCSILFNGYRSFPLDHGHNLYLNGELVTELTIPEGMTSIGDHAFEGCTSITTITIPNGVTSIGRSAFAGCSSLTAITIPEGVTSIGEGAFYECI